MQQAKYNHTRINLITGLLILVASTHTQLLSQCVIEDVYAEAHNCENGSVLIDVEFYSAGVENFSIVANGVDYGEYTVGEVFYTFGPVEAICDELTQISILSSEGPECNGEFVFDEPLCCENECTISNIFTTDINCHENGSVTFLLDFDVVGFENEWFDLFTGDTLYGIYGIEELPIVITVPNSEDHVVFEIAENDNPDCGNVFVFDPPNCDIDFCTVYNIEGGYLDCESPEEVYIELSFDYSLGLGESFTASLGDQSLGEFSFGMGAYLFGPLEANCNEDLPLIITPANEDSCEVEAFIATIPPCCDIEVGCYVFDVTAEGYECNEDDTTFYVDIAFEYTGDSGQIFTIVGNGNNYGTFEFGQPQYTIGPLESNCDLDYEFIIVTEQGNCESDYAGLLSPCCEEDQGSCSIDDLEHFDFICSDDGNFFTLWINFEPVNTTNDFYDVYVGGEYFESYLYSDLPQILEGIQVIEGISIITVCDNDNPDECCSTIELETNCETDEQDCNIFDVIAEGYECDNDNTTFLVDITFEYTGDPGEIFYIIGNGIEYGIFEFGQPHYTIGPIESDCYLDYEFIIITEQDNCEADFAGLVSPCCDDDVDFCSIGGLEFFDDECSDDLEFLTLWINFDPINTTNDFYDVSINGNYFATYLYADLPQIIEGIEVNEEHSLLTVCDNDNPNECCTSIEIPTDCDDATGTDDENDCPEWEVIIQDNENNTTVEVLTGAYGGTYTIEINEELQGTFAYGGSVILVLTPGMENTITLIDSENEECSLTLTVESEPISSVDTEEINAINLYTMSGSIIATNDVDFDMSVYGVDGHMIYTSSYSNDQQSVDHLISGLYVVWLERGGGVRVMRMVYVY